MLEQAAAWYAQLRDGRASVQQQQRWQQWLRAEPAHQHAWQQVQSISGSFAPLRELPNAETAVHHLDAANRRIAHTLARRRMLLGVVALAGMGASGWMLKQREWLPHPLMAWVAGHRTRTGEQRQILLADGGTLWLNTASAVDVDYDPVHRRIALRAGEILIDTARDPLDRPFVVDSPHGRLQALGTRFAVRLHEGATAISVFEGRVAVRPDQAQPIMLQPGQATRFTAAHIDAPTAAEAATQAWTQGLLVAHDMPLGAVVQELLRYRKGQITLAPGLAARKVYGSFPLHDTDRALAMIADVLKLRVEQPWPWRVSLYAA